MVPTGCLFGWIRKALFSALLWLWRQLGWLVRCLRSSWLFSLLEIVAMLSVPIVGLFWVFEADDRTKAKHYRAWELVNSARGSTGDGGRISALQDLNDDGVSLAAAPLEKANLRGIRLESANLRGANLAGADLIGADLAGADLSYADLRDAKLSAANLGGATFFKTDLTGANLGPVYEHRSRDVVTVSKAANLKGADLSFTVLNNARLDYVHLECANLFATALDGASLIGAKMWKARLDYVDLHQALGLEQEQVNSADGWTWAVRLPEWLSYPAHWQGESDIDPDLQDYAEHPLWDPENDPAESQASVYQNAAPVPCSPLDPPSS